MHEISNSEKLSNDDDWIQWRKLIIETLKRHTEKLEEIEHLKIEIELLKSRDLDKRIKQLEKLTWELNIKASIIAFVVSAATVAATSDLFKGFWSG